MGLKETKCIHVLATEDYAPELCAITLPTIRAYADRIGADFNLITTRKFPHFPINYERLQIYEAGKDYDWNINIDADMVIGKGLHDITSNAPPNLVRIAMKFDATMYFNVENDIYFQRDGRNVGIVDAFILTSRLTHDLWEPLPGPLERYLPVFKDEQIRRISEYCLSLNLAKYGLQYGGAFVRTDEIFHIGYTSAGKDDALFVAKAKASDWGW
ncbi:MAG: hypothetical protein RL518_1561 [Pseudomonadota bacterium]|jgi:hypothetical protein